MSQQPTLQRGGADEEFLKIISEGSIREVNKAFREFCRSNYPTVLNFVVMRGGSHFDAADVWQDALIAFWLNVKKGIFQGKCLSRTYVISIAKNIWLTRVNARKSWFFSALTHAEDIADEQAEYIVTREETREQVLHLLNEMRPNDREILLDYYYAEMEHEEIKRKYGLGSVQASKNKKCRALRALKNSYISSERNTALSGRVMAYLR